MYVTDHMKIDIDALLRARVPRVRRFLPRFVVKWVERLIRQDELNSLLEANAGLKGADFARGVCAHLDVKVEIVHPERLPQASCRRVVIVSNHPLGGLDGMALIDLLQRHFGGRVLFVVNDLLMAVEPLREVFLPVSKFGRQSREAMKMIDDAFEGSDPIIVFPAGLCSRLQTNPDGSRSVRDLKWQKMFVAKAISSRRDVVPLHFAGVNSMDFYKKADLRRRLRIPINLEQVLLPREMLASRGKTFKVTVGKTIPFTALGAEREAMTTAAKIKDIVYGLAGSYAAGPQPK